MNFIFVILVPRMINLPGLAAKVSPFKLELLNCCHLNASDQVKAMQELENLRSGFFSGNVQGLLFGVDALGCWKNPSFNSQILLIL